MAGVEFMESLHPEQPTWLEPTLPLPLLPSNRLLPTDLLHQRKTTLGSLLPAKNKQAKLLSHNFCCDIYLVRSVTVNNKKAMIPPALCQDFMLLFRVWKIFSTHEATKYIV